jgi:dipeptidyl aminopeptidase/acylaminoacyl peptidase
VPTTEEFTLDTESGPVRGIVDLPDRSGPRPTVVICHGFKGFMEWGFFPSLAELLAQRGFVAVRFNFRGGGMSPGDEVVTDTEAFRHATFGGDLEDVRNVLAATGSEIAPGHVDRERLGLFGHSRGGGMALLTSAQSEDVSAMVTWAAVSTFNRLGEETNQVWRAEGEVPVVNARTGQTLPVSVEVLEELEAHPERFDLEAAAGRRSAPWLIVHGELDPTVPIHEAELLSTAAAPRSRLHRIAGADHTLGAKHPFAGPTPMLIEAMNATQSWFRRHLAAEETS